MPIISRRPARGSGNGIALRVCSSFLPHAERAAERYGVPAHAMLRQVGEAGYVCAAGKTDHRRGQLPRQGQTGGSGMSDRDIDRAVTELLNREAQRRDGGRSTA
jgi:hypothetical protein